MVRGDRTGLVRRSTEVLVDVTTIIGAEEFITAQNRSMPPGDPFARQSFVELVQSLIFMSRVYVAHPTSASPTPQDFGSRPRLLGALMGAGLLHPLRLTDEQWRAAQTAEHLALTELQSWRGYQSLSRFLEQALLCDGVQPGTRNSLSARLHGWAMFQATNVRRTAGHHVDRISTKDGIEDDPFGEWSRAAAVALRGGLQVVAPSGEEPYVAATLARGMKYQARAEATSLSYQSHPMRRDFLLTFDLTREGAGPDVVLDVIKEVRGIHEFLASTAGDHAAHRIRLLELELPLLGGRLWRADETGRVNDPGWIDLVVHRVAEYRAKAVDLRRAIERCVTDEDYLRLGRDIDAAKQQLAERLGVRQAEPSLLERDLVDSVASVAASVPGIPKVSGLWVGARSVGKQLAITGTPVQRFLYKEFMHAWKRTGR